MKKIFILLILTSVTLFSKAQQSLPGDEPYGKVDQADLEMKACDFEKDANAEILIDKGDMFYDQSLNIVIDHHKRIKIFNDNGKGYANVRIEYLNYEREEYITGLQAETVNLDNGKIEVTKLDKKQIFNQVIDKYMSAISFSMPNVKAGSVIDIKYTWNTIDPENIPRWNFQDEIPERYNEFNTSIPEYFYFTILPHMRTPFSQYTTSQGNGNILIDNNNIPYSTNIEHRVMVNVPSLPDEYMMSSRNDNLESVAFQLTTFRPPYGFVQNFSNTWAKLGEDLVQNEDFGEQFKRKLEGEEELIDKAKSLKTDDEKIAYLFNQVKNIMKWNGEDEWYTDDGTSKAWENKTGNSTEINLILYDLLKKSGVNAALPMLVSTRKHGKVNPSYSFIYQFNRAVVYIPVDSTKKYILDASDKYNQYNVIPANLLNSSGFFIDADNKNYDLVFLDRTDPIRKAVYITADIKPEGKLSGTAQISSFDYNRINTIDRYKTDGETKYIDYLKDNDNDLKISSVKFDNMDVDSLPLVQNINFDLDLTGSDGTYIYLNPNLFTLLHSNPFLSESRSSDIDFGYRNNLSVTGVYKIPAGYTVDAQPKNVSMVMPDNSIVFRRFVGEQDGTIMVRFTIDYKKSIYFKEDYPTFHEFFKKMYEMMNEQIVFKKS